MDCSKCHKILDKKDFSFKNVDKKIYYLHCNNCRQKQNDEKKLKEKEEYLIKKLTNIIECSCGKKYVAFRDFHIYRHNNSLSHLAYKGKKI